MTTKLEINAGRKWSDSLILLTRQAINDCFIAPDGVLHMKNLNGLYGKISLANLITRQYVVEAKNVDSKYEFCTVDELLDAGWAID